MADVSASPLEAKLIRVKKESKAAGEDVSKLINRITMLQCQEAKMDREIENAREKTREALARKAEAAMKQKDEDVAATAKELLGTLGLGTPPGRRSLHATSGEPCL